MSERRIYMNSVGNCRDLGGLCSTDGKVIRSGRLYRSARLSRAEQKDIEVLREQCHLSLVIDLRTSGERQERPDVDIPGARHMDLPVFDGVVPGVTHDQKSDHERYLADLPPMADFYRWMIENEDMRNAIAGILHVITEHDENKGSILWHCSEGKDRCGVVSALVLAMLGVSEEDIMSDYLITNETNFAKGETAYERALAQGMPEDVAQRVRDMILAKEEYMRTLFEAVKKNYGSFEEMFTTVMGFTPEDIRDFRARMLEER